MTEQWQELKETITEMSDNGGTGTQQEVCKFLANYMETLEKQMQEPSEDTEVIKVSKGAVKARQGRFVIYDVNWFKEHFYSEEMIYGHPKQPSEDCISRKQALDDKGLAVFHRYDDYVKMRNYLKALPSVTPQRPKGKWIYEMKVMNNPYTYKCSVCKGWEKDKTKYCPNCGAEMSGGGEDADSD